MSAPTPRPIPGVRFMKREAYPLGPLVAASAHALVVEVPVGRAAPDSHALVVHQRLAMQPILFGLRQRRARREQAKERWREASHPCASTARAAAPRPVPVPVVSRTCRAPAAARA